MSLNAAIATGFIVGAALLSPPVQHLLGYGNTAEPLAEMIGGGLAAAMLAGAWHRWRAARL